MRWGFGWELGPFEIWEGLGIARLCDRMAAEGRPAPQWVLRHVQSGATRFYAEDGATALSLDGNGSAALSPRAGVLSLHGRGSAARRIAHNAGASLWDLGEGVLGLEFHSKMNALGGDAFAMGQKGIALAEREFAALVVGNEGTHFSAGANLALLLFAALEGEWEDIDAMVRSFQRLTMGLRQCARPVVVAPFSLTLGGGAEVALHGDEICAGAELYMGLVEVGVGLIPAGGGTKELYLRMLDAEGAAGDPRNAAKRAFEIIGMAKVSTSAHEARNFGLLRASDAIVLNSDRLLAAAKARALALARSGYRPAAPRAEIRVGGADTYALIEVGLYNFAQAGQISDHDVEIGRKLAGILSGGAQRGAVAATVSEQTLLDLEREAFLSLCGERKTLERIQHMLQRGKPLRN
jgi:3-hydroxyacyl-CoA dehydrogenase